MDKEQILAMQGRELDYLILTKIFDSKANGLDLSGWDVHKLGSFIPPYSTDISAAWEVVEKMKSDNWNFVLSDDLYQDRWSATFYWDPNQTPIEAESETAPEAISKCALLAVMEL